MGQGLGLLLLEETVGGLLGLMLGLLERRLDFRLGGRAEIFDLLGQFVFLRGQLVGGLGFQRLLLALLADLLLCLQGLGNLLFQGVGVHGFLQVADFLQKGLQGGDNFRLGAGRGRKVGVVKALLGLAQKSVDLEFFHHLHGFGGLSAHFAREVTSFPQTLLEPAEAGGHVALVLQGGQVQLRTTVGRFAGQVLGVLVHFRLMLDELADLAGQLSDLQPPQQDLLLDLDPHEDLAALAAGGPEGLDALGIVVQIDLFQDVDDLLHLLVHHLVEMIAHGTDLAVPGMRREVVVAKLLKLHVEHFADKLPGDVAGLLLDLFLLLQSLGRDGLHGVCAARGAWNPRRIPKAIQATGKVFIVFLLDQ